MKTIPYALVMLVPLYACAGNPADLVPKGPAAFQAGVLQGQSLEVAMYTDFQNDDRELRFLSAGTYSCGYPDDRRVHDALRLKNIQETIDARYKNNASWSASTTLIEKYAVFLDEVVKSDTASQETIKSLSTAIKAVSGIVPPIASLGVVAEPAGAFASSVSRYAAIGQMRAEAVRIKPALQKAVRSIKDLYPSMTESSRTAYALWNSCAREKLIFIRDVPFGRVKNYESYVGKSSGVELSRAYSEYLSKQTIYRNTPNIDKLLDAVLNQNDELAKNASKTSAKVVLDTAAQISDLVSSIQKASTPASASGSKSGSQ